MGDAYRSQLRVKLPRLGFIIERQGTQRQVVERRCIARIVRDDFAENQPIPPDATEQLRTMVGDSSSEVRLAVAEPDLELGNVEQALEAARTKLLTARNTRVRPGRDEKILTGWNGLMLAAFAEAARVLVQTASGHGQELNAE